MEAPDEQVHGRALAAAHVYRQGRLPPLLRRARKPERRKRKLRNYLSYYKFVSNWLSPSSQFDTKPKGLIPLGGCHVEEVARGPKGTKFGLKVSHADFPAGKVLVRLQKI